jgi:hypothetical protein
LLAYQNYLLTVRDPQSGLVRSKVKLSSARDAAVRQSSFYDNVILWRTRQLATQLGLDAISPSQLSTERQHILVRYWNQSEGHFIDDAAPGNETSYSSDWLIVLSTGFLNPANAADLPYLMRSSAYIDSHHLAQPLPIRYSAPGIQPKQNWAVRIFVNSYGDTAVWSYWGSEYIALEAKLYAQTGNTQYQQHARQAIQQWDAVIVRDRGFPETLNSQGKMLDTFAYKSIRQTGWVIDYEVAQYDLAQAERSHVPTIR